MRIIDLLNTRKSTRAFLPKPIAQDRLEEIFQAAMRAPSNCNVQPWQVYVASGDARDTLSNALLDELNRGAAPNPEVDWRLQFDEPLQSRKYESANALYQSMGIARDNKKERKQALLRNWAFFDAPHVAILTMEETLGIAGAVDVGIFAQSVALAAQSEGIATCFQASLNQFPGPIHSILKIPDSQKILFGISLGYEDVDAPVNKTKTDRESLNTLVNFYS